MHARGHRSLAYVYLVTRYKCHHSAHLSLSLSLSPFLFWSDAIETVCCPSIFAKHFPARSSPSVWITALGIFCSWCQMSKSLYYSSHSKCVTLESPKTTHINYIVRTETTTEAKTEKTSRKAYAIDLPSIICSERSKLFVILFVERMLL